MYKDLVMVAVIIDTEILTRKLLGCMHFRRKLRKRLDIFWEVKIVHVELMTPSFWASAAALASV